VGGSKKGLKEGEAKRRLAEHGVNELAKEKSISKFKILLEQCNNVLVYIILVATGLSIFLHHYTDAIFILIVVLINMLVGFFQEYKAEKTVRELKKMVAVKANVFRENSIKMISTSAVTIGDILILKAGDLIPADARIIQCDNFKTDEASLTGESFPVEKNKDLIDKEKTYADQKNMVFAGTSVAEGAARAVVVATGKNTQLGKIVDLVNETTKERTPLQKKIAQLSLLLGFVIVALVGVVFGIGVISGYPLHEIFVAAVALAVSVIPEGLLPAITIVLVIGMRRLLKKKALTKRLSATETLGGVTTICIDKTGTLTEGKMRVSHILAKSKSRVLQAAILVGEAYVENLDDELSKWVVRGRPTDKALLESAIEAGVSVKEAQARFKEEAVFLFNSKSKYALRIYFDKEKKEYILLCLGAPEILLEKTSNFQITGVRQEATEDRVEDLNEQIDDFAKKGLRVIACGQKILGSKLPDGKIEDLFEDISFLGVIALRDPLRKDAAYAMRMALRAGIRPIIVTGDHMLTARTIAEEIGYSAKNDEILQGKDVDKMSSEELAKAVRRVKLFSRVSPENKLRIVEALQSHGEVVAMTGDGVNDAPALKKADIGIALGSGTNVAKEAADIVLLDDNFKVMINAIEEGRTIFENIRKVLIYLVADGASELFLFLVVLLLRLPIPLLPIQILWINIVEDGLPDVALATERKEKEFMRDKPRDPKEPILNKSLKKWIVIVSALSFISAFAVFFSLVKFTDINIVEIRTIVFILMSLDSLIFAFVVRSFRKKFFRKDIFSNRYLDVAVLIGGTLLLMAVYVPLLQKVTKTCAIGIMDWLIIIFAVAIEMTIINKTKIWLLKEKSEEASLA